MICCTAGSEQADEAVVGFADSATGETGGAWQMGG